MKWVALLLLAPAGLAAQTTGTLVGDVVDAVSGAPISGATISLLRGRGGTARTDAGGSFKLQGIHGDTITLRVEHAGHVAMVDQVVLERRSTVTVQVRLWPLASVLETISVSTGRPTSPSERGARLGAGSDAKVVRTPGELVDGGVVGLDASRAGGQLGGALRFQIRGHHSFTLPDDPLVYVDGIRIAPTKGVGPAGSGLSILDVVDPASIDRIEVIRSVAAAQRYGLGAGNGVILIYTKARAPERP